MKPAGQRPWVAQALIGLVCVALAGLVGRLIHIHRNLRPALQGWTQSRLYGTIELPARRGTILDRRGRTLAGSYDRPSLFADPELVS